MKSGVCSKKLSFSFKTASAIISDLARKGELLFTNSDQIEVDDYANFRKTKKVIKIHQVKRDGRELNRATNLSPPPKLKMTDIKQNSQTTNKSKFYNTSPLCSLGRTKFNSPQLFQHFIEGICFLTVWRQADRMSTYYFLYPKKKN